MALEPEDVAAIDHDDVLPELTFDAQRYPARPAKLRPAARRRKDMLQAMGPPPFEPDGRNKAYVEWLVNQSMLGDSITMARQLAGLHTMWSNSYASPDPRAAVDRTSVWFTAYPLSLVSAPGTSPQRIVPWSPGAVKLAQDSVAFREPAEKMVKVTDYAQCAKLPDDLAAKDSDIEAAIRSAAGK